MTRFLEHPSLTMVLTVLAGACVSVVLLQKMVTEITKEKKNDDNNDASASSFMEIIQRRRSIFPKQYSTKRVPRHILDDMLEASRWAPTHNLTEPWKFIVFESPEYKQALGQFLANQYKASCEASGKSFLQAKYDKKITNAQKASFVIAILCHYDNNNTKNPLVEEICSVAMAVQNMLLVASAHEIGAYWSTSSVHVHVKNRNNNTLLANPPATREFLNLPKEEEDDPTICMGWVFVGDYHGDDNNDTTSTTPPFKKKKWPAGKRKDMVESGRLSFR